MIYAEGLQAGWEYPASCYKDYVSQKRQTEQVQSEQYEKEEEDYYPDDY